MKRWLRALAAACTSKGWPRRLLICAALALVGVLIWVGYAANVPGFVASGDPKTAQYQPGKTVWDWLQLLIVPAVLAGAALWFNSRQSKREQQTSEVQSKIEREIAQDQQRENALQSYLDHMTELLLKENLLGSKEGAEVRQIARVRTLTALRTLDARRNAIVLRFLQEAGLREKEHPIVDLRDIELGDVDLQEADLSSLNLNELSLHKTNMRKANLIRANLSEANLWGANLTKADLTGANLTKASLFKSDLTGANLILTTLSEANLTGSNITDGQLKVAKSLEGATRPDGTKHA